MSCNCEVCQEVINCCDKVALEQFSNWFNKAFNELDLSHLLPDNFSRAYEERKRLDKNEVL